MSESDRFASLSIDAGDLALPGAASLFQALGVLHVRNAVPVSTLERIRTEVLEALDALSEEVGERVPYITVMRGEYDPAMPKAYERLVLLLQEVLSPDFPYREAIMNLVGARDVATVMAYAREARTDGGATAHVPFHQDYPSFIRASEIEAHLKPKRTVTCWLPLDPIDAETPKIEYLPAHLDVELPPDADGLLDMEKVGGAVDKLPRWVPPVSMGDMCLHDQFTLHRSHVTPDTVKPRRSFELRFVMV